MPAKSNDFVSVVERCYEPHGDDQDWLASLFDVASPLLDLGGGIGMTMVREGPDGHRIALSRAQGRVQGLLRASWTTIEGMSDETYRRFYYPPEPVLLASTAIARLPFGFRAIYAGMMKVVGASDLIAMLGYPARGFAFAMYGAILDQPLDARMREVLRRLRIHVEASLRLRMFSDSEAVAVLRPDGRLEHLAEGLQTEDGRDLSEQTVLIEGARSSLRADAQRALDAWQALVDGQWSVVERRENDGKRHYHVFENAPQQYAHRALSDSEAMVLGLSLRGLSGKDVAYATGLSSSHVSTLLASAAERLGFPSREELLRVGAALTGEEPPILSADFTQAEQEVLDLVRAGHSNRAIAATRGTAVRTVANQVSSLLRKTGANSRRALIVGRGQTRAGEAP